MSGVDIANGFHEAYTATQPSHKTIVIKRLTSVGGDARFDRKAEGEPVTIANLGKAAELHHVSMRAVEQSRGVLEVGDLRIVFAGGDAGSGRTAADIETPEIKDLFVELDGVRHTVVERIARRKDFGTVTKWELIVRSNKKGGA